MMKGISKTSIHTEEKKKKRKREKNVDKVEAIRLENEEDKRMQIGKKKEKSPITKIKNKDKNLVGRQRLKNEVDLKEQTCNKSKNTKKIKKEENFVDEVQRSPHAVSVDSRMQVGIKEKSSSSTKRKNKGKNLVGKQRPNDEVDLVDQSDGVVDNCASQAQQIEDFKEPKEADIGVTIKPCKSKKAKKKIKEENFVKEVQKSPEKEGVTESDEIYVISSGDEDCSKGMKKWIMDYHQSRPGLEALKDQIDDFITTYEAKVEEERKERETRAAEGGWTVVVHHKGRKKTTDSESGIAVGSVAQAAVEEKAAKKKRKEVGLDFYRFQKKEVQRNEIMMLQSKFEEDKKRLQQLRAARKFRPY